MPDTLQFCKNIKNENRIWKKANVLLTGMEAAAILVIATIRGCKAAGIMVYSDSNSVDENIEKEIEVVCEVIRLIIK